MELNTEEGSGAGQFEVPGTSLSFEWPGECLILPSFAGNNSIMPAAPGTVVVAPPTSEGTASISYTATGTEGTTLTLPPLAGKTILLFALESVLLDVIYTTPGPTVREVLAVGNTFTFYEPLPTKASIKILYK
jgi:hypothetical protein